MSETLYKTYTIQLLGSDEKPWTVVEETVAEMMREAEENLNDLLGPAHTEDGFRFEIREWDRE